MKIKRIIKMSIITLILVILWGMTVNAAPEKVTGVKCTYGTMYSLSWNPAAGATYYKVEQSTDKQNWTTVRERNTSTSISVSIIPDKINYLRVTGKEGITGPLGEPSDILAMPGKATIKGDVLQVDASKNSVTLRWSGGGGATKYKIYEYGKRPGSNNFERLQLYTTTTSTTVRVDGLEPGTKRNLIVVPEMTVNGVTAEGKGESIFSASTIPGEIKGFKVKRETQSRVCLEWERAESVVGHQVQAYTVGGKKIGELIDPYHSASIAYVNGIKADQFYKIQVRSYIATRTGRKYSEWTTFQVANRVTLKSKKEAKKIKLSWGKVKGATNYEVYGRKGYTAKFKKIKTANKNHYTVKKIGKKKLKKDSYYEFYIVAIRKEKGKTYKSIMSSRYGVKTLKK